jgi:hypothetical protein
MEDLLITVKAEYMQESRTGCRGCPVARAFIALGFNHVSVGTTDAVVFFGKTPVHVGLPHSAQQFIQDWDSGRRVKPLAFTVDLHQSLTNLREIGYKFLPNI